MRDPQILQQFTDEGLGIEFEQIHTSPDIRAEFPFMPETYWGAWPIGYPKPGMCVGATSEEALRKLYEKHPELRNGK